MEFAALTFPSLDPVALSLGPLQLRWYALAYVAGLVFAWWHVRNIASEGPSSKRILEKKDSRWEKFAYKNFRRLSGWNPSLVPVPAGGG